MGVECGGAEHAAPDEAQWNLYCRL